MTKGRTRRVRQVSWYPRMDALLGAVWLYAADVPRSVEFFRDKVGLPLLEGEDFHFDAGNIRLSIHAARYGKPAGDGAFYVFVVDDIQAVSDLLVLHDVDEPLAEVREMADVLVKAAEANVALIGKLSRLRGIEPELEAVDRLESEADRIYRRTVAHLFSGDFNAFDVLRWKGIVEAIESAINGIERVSDVVAAIVIKHA